MNELKTVLAVYISSKSPIHEYKKQYAFNVRGEVRLGDSFKKPDESGVTLKVVKIYDRSFPFFNKLNGELLEDDFNTNAFPIKELVITPSHEGEVIYVTRVDQLL